VRAASLRATQRLHGRLGEAEIDPLVDRLGGGEDPLAQPKRLLTLL
jgi:hypothetical protein